jgi:hypothetical protein
MRDVEKSQHAEYDRETGRDEEGEAPIAQCIEAAGDKQAGQSSTHRYMAWFSASDAACESLAAELSVVAVGYS